MQLKNLSGDFFMRLDTLGRWRDSGECATGFLDQQPKSPDDNRKATEVRSAERNVSGLGDLRQPDCQPHPWPVTGNTVAHSQKNSQSISISQSELSRPLRRLAAALETMFCLSGQLKDLDEAISLYRVALQLHPSPHSSRSDLLQSLANALRSRSDWIGRRTDLDEAVLLNREALEMLRSSNDDRSYALNRCAVLLHRRFVVTGQDEDLDDAITLFKEALELQPPSNPNRSLTLTDLAAALITEYQSGTPEVLEDAIALIREAIGMQPASHPDMLHSLAEAIYQRYLDTEQAVDRDEIKSLEQEAIILKRGALARLPAPHPIRSTLCQSLADNLLLLFKVMQEISFLSDALAASQESIQVLPEGHPAHCRCSVLLGKILQEMYDVTQRSCYLDDSMTAYRAATKCKSASPLERFDAAIKWVDATYMGEDSRHDSALEAYQSAIELRTLLAPLDLDIQTRYRGLIGTEEVVSSAATYAALSGRFDKAVEFLEHGRTVFWSQALQLRLSTDKIYDVAPELWRKLDALSQALEKGSHRDTLRTESCTQEKVIAIEQDAIRYHRLKEDWLVTVDEVRRLDGFEDFLRMKPFSTLQRAAVRGPVVMLVDPGLYDEEDTFTALVMTSSGVGCVSLPLMTLDHANELVDLVQSVTLPDADGGPVTKAHLNFLLKGFSTSLDDFKQPLPSHAATSSSLNREDRATRRTTKFAADPDDIFRCVLAILWKAVIQPVIHYLALPKSNSPPHLWWCPTGKLALLPIHAAGIYSVNGSDCMSDYVISSYTPTLNTLLSPPAPNDITMKVMVVIQPQTAGYASLPFTRDELRNIKRHVPKEVLITLGTPEDPAFVERVLSHFSDIAVVHLACHGERGEDSPLNNAFVLEGAQKLKVSGIMGLPIRNALLAFLCACHTAAGDDQSPDEAINLATSLLFAGFRGSIATMWSIADEDGPKIADSVYGRLFESNVRPDAGQAAQALHFAVTRLRAENCSFKRWVPFIHLGL